MKTQQHWSNAEQSQSDYSPTGCFVSNCRESSEPVFDVLNVEELQNRCMGNLELVHRVLSKFQVRFPEEMAEIQKALETGDVEHVARVAHRVKGTSASVSANGLTQAAAELEELTRSGSGNNFTVCLNRLDTEWNKFQVEVKAALQ